MATILIADDEEGIREFLSEALASEGHEITQARDGREALDLIQRRSFHLLLSDLSMPELDGLALTEHVRQSHPEMEVVILTAHGSIQSAVKAMRMGAFDYLTKPLSSPVELRLVVERALERRRLRQGQQQRAESTTTDLIAVAPAMLTVVRELNKVAPTTATVLLLGESGTGKEVAARRIHAMSSRSEGPFVAVNCAALSAQLVESEMFGHEKGAFTGASERRRGRFELADGGTLFLDEVAELPAPLQAKLLRVLQERTFERVGGTCEIHVDVRLIAATNRDLETEIETGGFRADLYHRLAVFPVILPPLRDRLEDILPLADHLLDRISRELGRKYSLDPSTHVRLQAHRWPGNVRELSNVLERAAIMTTGEMITNDDLVFGHGKADNTAALDGTLEQLEREAIRQALKDTGGHRKRAAERLGIGLRTLYDKLKAYDIDG